MLKQQELDQFRNEILRELIFQIPFCNALEIQIDNLENEIIPYLPFKKDFIGNTKIPALHGGVIGSFLEITAIIHLTWTIFFKKNISNISQEQISFIKNKQFVFQIPKTIDFTIDYLNSGRSVGCFAKAKVNKIGRRYASISVKTWQEKPSKPFALGLGHFLISI